MQTNPYQSPKETDDTAVGSSVICNLLIAARWIFCLVPLGFVSTFLHVANHDPVEIEKTASGGYRFAKVQRPAGQKEGAILFAASYILVAISLFPLLSDRRIRWSLAAAANASLLFAAWLAPGPHGAIQMAFNCGFFHILGLTIMVAEPFVSPPSLSESVSAS